MNTQTAPKGFSFEGKQIFFIDGHGKDISFNRWRIILYYHLNFALTHFVNSQAEYDQFIAKYQPYCYTDYEEYRNTE